MNATTKLGSALYFFIIIIKDEGNYNSIINQIVLIRNSLKFKFFLSKSNITIIYLNYIEIFKY